MACYGEHEVNHEDIEKHLD